VTDDAEGILPGDLPWSPRGDVPWSPRGDEPGDPAVSAEGDTRSLGAAWADDSTDSFSAVSVRQNSGGFRLSLPGEGTDTFPGPGAETLPAAPRAEGSEPPEDE
jgi:hypothetical protein